MGSDRRAGRTLTIEDRSFTLRVAIREDLDALHELECRAHQAPWSRDAFEDELERRESQIWVLDEGERLGALLVFWRVLDEIEIMDIAVDPLRQGLGLGRYLLETLIALSRVQGVRRIALEVRVSNDVAIHLYEKVGFVRRGRRPDYYEDNGEDAFIMVWESA
jgi:[ribosomal protein S18]-alanine N-acetyltransferase